MSEKKQQIVYQQLYFNDGCVKAREHVYIAGKLHSLDPRKYDFSRMTYYKNGQWGKRDFEWNVASVYYSLSNDTFYTLAIDGDVGISSKGVLNCEKISGAGISQGLGAVKQIRAIGNFIYVCGDQGQVYKRDETGWKHMDKELLDKKISATALDLNSIDGSSENNIYVVGFHGKIFHYDGKKWNAVQSPTTKHLERVRVVNENEVYICGNDGTLLKGNKNGFEDFSLNKAEEHFWGIEYFQDKIYLASLNGLYVFDGKKITSLKTGLTPEIGGYRLDARDGALWSFGVDDLAFFDGNKWTRIIHPDNEAADKK